MDLNLYEQDKIQINYLFNQIITLGKYYNTWKSDKTNQIIVIWLPINKSRDFNYQIVNNENLKECEKNFNAFVASGVTYGSSSRYTIITRYEEVSKLLLHELIHNFNMDGNLCHNTFNNIISKYKKTKGSNYNYEYSMYESYTELLSSYYNIIFTNMNNELNKINMIEKIKIQIIIELLYSYNTIANLIIINGYKTYEEFMEKEFFYGNICIYEYYYLKGLMYNNFPIIIIKPDNNNCNKFNLMVYESIIKLKRFDKLLQEICNNYIKQTNYSYIFIK